MRTKENEKLIVLAGGTNIEVTLRDGTTETMFIRKVPMRHMYQLGKAWGKEAEEIAVYVAGDKPAGWIDTLTDEAWEEVVKTGRELNEGPFGRWFARQQQAMKAVGVNLDQVIEKSIVESAVSIASQQPTSS